MIQHQARLGSTCVNCGANIIPTLLASKKSLLVAAELARRGVRGDAAVEGDLAFSLAHSLTGERGGEVFECGMGHKQASKQAITSSSSRARKQQERRGEDEDLPQSKDPSLK
jgi:hypothetical protein